MKKIILILILLFFFSCEKKEYLDFPENLDEITEVELVRPDLKSGGKFTQIKELNKSEIKQLIEVIKNAKPIGIRKIKTDFYITFTSKNLFRTDLNKLKVSGNIIKDYGSDLAYKIEDLKFLKDF